MKNHLCFRRYITDSEKISGEMILKERTNKTGIFLDRQSTIMEFFTARNIH